MSYTEKTWIDDSDVLENIIQDFQKDYLILELFHGLADDERFNNSELCLFDEILERLEKRIKELESFMYSVQP